MTTKKILLFVDDAIGYDSLVDGTVEALEKSAVYDVRKFNDFETMLEKGIIYKNDVECCVLDPQLTNSEALEREYLYDSTLFKIDSLFKYVKNDLKIVIVTSLIDSGILENRIKEKFPNVLKIIYKKDFIKGKLLTNELASKILSYF